MHGNVSPCHDLQNHQTPFPPVATRVDWATLAARAELVGPYLVPVMFPELSEKRLATSVYQV